MSWLNSLERRLEPVAISNLTLYLVVGQTFTYLTSMLGLLDVRYLYFVPALVLNGEWWRLFSFIFVAPRAHWLFIAFLLYFLYFAGTALEAHWGRVRYNLFLFTGYVLTVALAFVAPYNVASNVFIGGAIFLAFAHLNPDFTMYLFLVLPVKIKWLALVAWVFYGYTFVVGGVATKLGVVAAVGNFLLFFGRSLIERLRPGRRQTRGPAGRSVARREAAAPRHQCLLCDKNSNTHPYLDFRYCSKCVGDQCYCPDHLREHVHVTEEPPAKP